MTEPQETTEGQFRVVGTSFRGPLSPETAIVQWSYPFGRQRCVRRVWLEQKKNTNEWRMMAQTTQKHINQEECAASQTVPSGGGDRNANWNNPKKSTYQGFFILYTDRETGFLHHDSLSKYAWKEQVEEFLNRWHGQLTEAEIDFIRRM